MARSEGSMRLSAARRREIAELRLIAQGVVDRPFADPRAVARHLGCLQGQHLGGVMAATALRLHAGLGLTEVRAGFADGSIVRGYPMRGTVFLVAADDIAWMTEITSARQLQGAATRRAEHGFSEADLDRAAEVARAALAEAPGASLSREGLSQALSEQGIALDGGQRYHLIYSLIVAGMLVYGPLHGSD
ncbi:MAG: crosslink repair DNA glycosylase YcaQ family protein, partial [Propionibacteriaceae bacterium]|nr:crosslink repair DNA glycosylase YcaQ family protein [Propionibacteriaceae bacterium]